MPAKSKKQQMAAGAGHIVAPGVRGSLVGLLAEKAPVALSAPGPTIGDEQSAAISAKAPHPNAARLLMNYLLDREAQTILTQDGYSSAIPDLPGAPPLSANYQAPKIREATADEKRLLELIGIR